MKKVLIITYYWPPAGGAGVQRALKFAKYLPDFGWQPVILTVENPDCPVVDKTLLKDIPDSCKVYRTKTVEPFELYKKLTGKQKGYKIPSDVLTKSQNLTFTERLSQWVRFNLFIPDAKIGWMFYAVSEAKKIIRDENIDIILSTSPPPTVSMVAKRIANSNKLRWIADFRDPWLEIVHYQNVKRNWLTKFIDGKFERSVLKKADHLLTISNDIVKLFKSKVGEKNYSVIPNGFDESDFKVISSKKNSSFIIAYTGVITKTRVPYVFLNAMEKLITIDGIKDIKFVIAGRTCPEFTNELSEKNIDSYVEERGFLPHHESTQILQNSDILLLVIDNVPNNKGFLTGKIFEYLGSKTPIYAIGPVDGEAREIITETNSGKMIDYSDDDGAYILLKEMYSDWKKDIEKYNFNIEKYSRRNQAKQLSKILEELSE